MLSESNSQLASIAAEDYRLFTKLVAELRGLGHSARGAVYWASAIQDVTRQSGPGPELNNLLSFVSDDRQISTSPSSGP